MSESRSQGKPFEIPKQMVWEAYQRVKANKGAAGVDGQSVEQFEQDLINNLYRLWNRMSSGSYFPPPVKAVEIPKASGGVRILGIPTVADRIAQTVVAMYLERLVEPVFHPDSYGYRPGRSALDAVAVCRERCWRNDWVIDLDVRAFFDSVDHSLMLKAVERHTDAKPRSTGELEQAVSGLIAARGVFRGESGRKRPAARLFCGLSGFSWFGDEGSGGRGAVGVLTGSGLVRPLRRAGRRRYRGG